MYSPKETDDNKSKRRRLTNETLDNVVDPNLFELEDNRPNKQKNGGDYYHEFKKSEPATYYEFEDRKGKSMDEEFMDHMGRLAQYDSKFDDPWMKSLNTSEYDDTELAYEMEEKQDPPKVTKMDILYHLPRVEVIRLLVSKLEDGQSPSEYLKSEDFKNKTKQHDGNDEYAVSDLAHVLTMEWKNVYFMTREDIVDSLLNYKNNGKERKNYEFRWLKDELAVHGPYSHEDILMWVVYGYVTQENPILVRELDSDGNLLTHDWTHYMDSDIYNIFPPSTVADYGSWFKSGELPRDGADGTGDHPGYCGKKPDFLYVRKRRSRRFNRESGEDNDDDDEEDNDNDDQQEQGEQENENKNQQSDNL